MLNVGIYRTVCPYKSEKFIYEQAASLKKYIPFFIMRTRLKKMEFKSTSISDDDKFGLKQKIFAINKNCRYFKNKELFKYLNLIHAHFGPDGIYAMEIARKYDIPFLVTFHGGDITLNKWNMVRSLKPSVYQYLFNKNKLMERSSAFIAISRFIENRMIEDGYSKKKVIQHYIGVNIEKFKPLKKKNSERYILCVGRHTESKGIETLLSSFYKIAGKHPRVFLLQVGSGTMTKRLFKHVNLLGINNRVRFLGALSNENVIRLMQGAEIFALTSQTAKSGASEGLGIVFNEASACGVPIVSTWHGGIPEAVLDGETGLLSAEKDETAIAEKLDILLSEKGFREKLGMRGREYVCDVFDIYKQTAKLEGIYDEILSQK